MSKYWSEEVAMIVLPAYVVSHAATTALQFRKPQFNNGYGAWAKEESMLKHVSVIADIALREKTGTALVALSSEIVKILENYFPANTVPSDPALDLRESYEETVNERSADFLPIAKVTDGDRDASSTLSRKR